MDELIKGNLNGWWCPIFILETDAEDLISPRLWGYITFWFVLLNWRYRTYKFPKIIKLTSKKEK